MKININHSFPRCFFPSQERKAAIGYNQQVQIASNNKTILEIVQQSLSEVGHLFQHSDGSIQLEVDDSYFDDLLPLIDENILCPAFELCKSSILLFSAQEVLEYKIDFQTIAPTCNFRVEGCFGIEPLEREDIAKVWVLLIQSEEMEALRKAKGLSALVHNQPFYLLMGMEKYYYSLEDVWPSF